MDAVGERWALLIVRELIFGPKRFRDLRAGLPQVSQNVLSQRLRDLEEKGIVRHTRLGPPVSAQVYQLTDRGRELEPTLIALARWGAKQPAPKDAPMSTDSFMLMLKALYRPQSPSVPPMTIRLHFAMDTFEVEVGPAAVDVGRGSTARPDVTITASVAVLREIMFTDRTLESATEAGDLDLTGDPATAAHFFTLFRPPD
jgi:DNA-binding HxlR family transcriptional regulator